MTTRISLRPEAVKVLRTLRDCGTWHAHAASKNFSMLRCLCGDGLVSIIHSYQRTGKNWCVYQLTTLGQIELTHHLAGEAVAKERARREARETARMNAAF